jgi:ferredoxin-NADP reductase
MPIIKKYKSQVVSVLNPVENVYTVEFRNEVNGFRFLPGQFLHLALSDYDPSGEWPESRCFSMQTSPSEKTVKITYSVKGRFTKQMAEQLKPGVQVWLKLPYGELFTQDSNKKNTIFIAGGTGITPFLSLFTDPSFEEYENPKLYAGFRSYNFDIYNAELETAKQFSPTLQIIKFYEDKDGVIDIERILNENSDDASFFISGPPAMIKIFSGYLKQKGVSENRVKTDEWE